jgi:hypothetical protein
VRENVRKEKFRFASVGRALERAWEKEIGSRCCAADTAAILRNGKTDAVLVDKVGGMQ